MILKRKKIVFAIITLLILVCTIVASIVLTQRPKETSGETIESMIDDSSDGMFREFAITPDGYYYIENELFLKFYDKKSDKHVYVCNKPNCSHKEYYECDAFFDPSAYNISFNGICYYNDTLYTTYYDMADETCYLCEIAKDGSSRKKLCKLGKYKIGTVTAFTKIMHGNYVYYTYDVFEENSLTDECKIIPKLYRSDYINDKKPEELTSAMDIENIKYIYSPKVYKSHIYFVVDLEANSEGTIIGKLMSYNTETNEMEEVLERELYEYVITDDAIYYTNRNHLVRYDKETKEEKELYEMDYTSNLFSDGNYLYLDDACASPEFFHVTEEEMGRTITVLDKKGKVIEIMKDLDKNYIMQTVDDNYLFFSYYGDIKLIKKDSIGTPDVKLIPFSHL